MSQIVCQYTWQICFICVIEWLNRDLRSLKSMFNAENFICSLMKHLAPQCRHQMQIA